ERAGVLGALHETGAEREHSGADLADALRALGCTHHDFSERAVAGLQLEVAPEAPGQATPRIRVIHSLLHERDELADLLLEQLLNQVRFVGKPAVDGSDPDAGMVGD